MPKTADGQDGVLLYINNRPTPTGTVSRACARASGETQESPGSLIEAAQSMLKMSVSYRLSRNESLAIGCAAFVEVAQPTRSVFVAD